MADRPGLRERKKGRTRRAIRAEAFRLFREQGFGNTTVEQIAEAADVSPRTFYRYFASKEAVLISDDHTTRVMEAFVAAPSELTPVAAYRHAVAEVFGGLSDEERHDAIAGQQLLYQIPEARGVMYAEYVKVIDLITQALPRRLGAPTGEAERRVIAGAIVGVVIAAAHNTPLPDKDVPHALSILDQKLPWR